MIRRRTVLGGLSGVLFASRLYPSGAWAAQSPVDLDPLLEAVRKRLGVPGIGAIVVGRDRVMARGEAGVRKTGEEGLISADAHWQLGSITKTFTATLAAILIERGKLTWDTRLREIYPEHLKLMANGVPDITVRQLVTHTSGMFRGDIFGWDGVPEINQPGLTLSQRRQRGVVLSLKAPLEFVPGSKHSYSNRGYNTLGPALEKVVGKSFEDMILQDIAKPLGIGSVIFGEPALDAPKREPWPHLLEGRSWKAVPPVPREMYGYHVFNTAGGISLTLAGIARWMQAHMNGEGKAGILSEEMFKLIHSPSNQGGVPALGLGAHALGRRLFHTGSNGRNAAEMIVLPDAGVGLFLTTNAVAPANPAASFVSTNMLYALGFPGRWPMPALKPPEASSDGVVEGEALELISLSGGRVEFQMNDKFSGAFQLWWIGAKEGDRLVARLRAPVRGRYVVDGVFTRNADYGSVTIAIGSMRKRMEFRAERLAFENLSLGETKLEAGPQDVVFTAHGDAGQNGINCHLGLDLLRLRPMVH